ncbi:hypothetical protein SAMN04490182_2852 [Pseudomonas cedrina]|uniref:Uncharacterized protein n=2 Tax=Pseudomonas cedrina TaxID=651740 RepID=A0A1V2KG65_PSECE|nr:hypothetical protein [Pseudomonas cedrina]ONH55841.1 hypothetical protein BLL36_06925 [Pseudomonas cedrina subsp. cedrina]SDS95171.1 hypothetical protein SAMN04490182_2852 [Pseudomonas cedrina]
MSNAPTSPNSFEHSRLADLIAMHQAIAALGQVTDLAAGQAQQAALYARLEALHPTLISVEERGAFNLLIGSMAVVRAETLGARSTSPHI